MQHLLRQPAFRKVDFPPVNLDIIKQDDGTIYLQSAQTPPAYDPNLLSILQQQARSRPETVFLQEKDPQGAWRGITYRDFFHKVLAAGTWLRRRDIPKGQSLLILSGNSIHHAIFTFAGLYAGVPVCPVSVNYALMGNYERLDYVRQMITPAIIFAEQTSLFHKTLEYLNAEDVILITEQPDRLLVPAIPLTEILEPLVDPAEIAPVDQVNPDGIFKLMLTSGSTGAPKTVIHTSRMLAANAAFCNAVMKNATSWADKTLDWLPWNHASGALVLVLVMMNGGTLYIDDGRPLPGLFEKSIANIRELNVSFLTNIPLAYELLARELEKDEEFRKQFFTNIRHLVYGGAGISRSVYDRFQKMALTETGEKILFGSGYGATETTSGVLCTYFEIDGRGIGLPQPGVKIKMVPARTGYELRLAGDIITPGYYGRADLNETILDEEGYYSIGDLVDWVDRSVPEQGLKFVGRLSDEFKLATGTWVNSSALRDRLLRRLAPDISELVVCGLNQDYIALLAWPDPERVQHSGFADRVLSRLAAHNREFPGSSTRIARLTFLDTPPDPSRHELSDKGTVNATAVQANRADMIESLFAENPDERVLVIPT
ncbi:AMP-binding protein [Luteithermobacter gelatinilyticus]|uniref:AMP-binding protein n=1 Tax=Luteithermobacter gelatinilyticus TaxID=2582913 RepID=UPI0011071027|nr:AMP-binding protein [Luteithermobacter gelatinilyticus]